MLNIISNPKLIFVTLLVFWIGSLNLTNGESRLRHCHYDEYCCGSYDWDDLNYLCTKCCDTHVGTAIGLIVGLAIGIPVLIIVSVIVICCFCPGCPGHRRRYPRSVVPPMIVMGQQNPGYNQGQDYIVRSPAQNQWAGPSRSMPYTIPANQPTPPYPPPKYHGPNATSNF